MIIIAASQLYFLANKNVELSGPACYLHKNRAPFCTTEWSYCSFAVLWARYYLKQRNETVYMYLRLIVGTNNSATFP